MFICFDDDCVGEFVVSSLQEERRQRKSRKIPVTYDVLNNHSILLLAFFIVHFKDFPESSEIESWSKITPFPLSFSLIWLGEHLDYYPCLHDMIQMMLQSSAAIVILTAILELHLNQKKPQLTKLLLKMNI